MATGIVAVAAQEQGLASLAFAGFEHGLNGSWLLAVVACQSVAVVFAMLSPQYAQPARLHLNFAALALWLAAGMLYTAISSSASRLRTSRPRTGSTWARWRSRRSRGRCCCRMPWSTVFPLGMYSVATAQMKNALQLEFLAPVASAFCCIAIAAWIVAAATWWMRD